MSWTNAYPAFSLCFLAVFIQTCQAQTASPSTPSPSVVFPADNEVVWRTISSAVHLLGVSILACCLARRTDKLSARGLTSIPIARWLVILIFADSWLFLFSAGLLISGIGLSLNSESCSAAIFLCIVLYAVSKLLIYWFLVEKVYLVHRRLSRSRLECPAYRLCIIFVFGYVAILILMITGRIAYIRDGAPTREGTMYDKGMDGACVIGLGRVASMSILIYDLVLNVFFTCMFLYPVYKSSYLSPRLKAVAKRTLIAALVALITSAINVCVLTVLHGQELGWICLASCGADVAVNAMAIYAVTASFDDHVFSEPDASVDNESVGRRFIKRVGLGRIFPDPPLPITYPMANTSTRGILEKSNRDGRSTNIVSSTHSVHFSPDTKHQSRGPTVVDIQETDKPFDSVDRSEQAPVGSSSLPSLLNTRDEVNSDIGTTEYRGQVRTSRLGRRELPDAFQQQPQSRPFAVTPLSPIVCSPADPGADTSVVIRHEGPVMKKLPQRSSVISSTGSINSRKRSKSVETSSDITHANCTVTSLSQAPATLEEARDRMHILSALTEIAGGKKRGQLDQNLLEISVFTQTDRRIETPKRPRSDLLGDYHGRRYGRRGRSFGSSGEL